MRNLKFAKNIEIIISNLGQLIGNCKHELANENLLIDSNVAMFRGNEHPV